MQLQVFNPKPVFAPKLNVLAVVCLRKKQRIYWTGIRVYRYIYRGIYPVRLQITCGMVLHGLSFMSVIMFGGNVC